MNDVIEREKDVNKQIDNLFKSKCKLISNTNNKEDIKKLKDICLIKDNLRKPINSIQRDLIKGDIPYFGANGLVDYLNDYIFNEDLVLIAEDGGNFNEFYDREIAYIVSGKSWVNNHAHVLTVKNNSFPIDWLFYSLVHKNILKHITGTTRLKLNKSDLENITIWLPKLNQINNLISEMQSVDFNRKQINIKLQSSQTLQKSLINQVF
jgi:type I restriction enzyme S subunit